MGRTQIGFPNLLKTYHLKARDLFVAKIYQNDLKLFMGKNNYCKAISLQKQAVVAHRRREK